MGGYQPFHQQLRYERARRSWSQADVAEKVGVDVKTVNRWEKGSRKPLPFYRQRLCQLFNKNAEEFGLLETINHDPAIPSPPAAIYPQTSDILESGSLSPFPSEWHHINDSDPPSHLSLHADWSEAPHIGRFYGRARELDTLSEWIINDCCRIVAVLGMGGVGKTTLTAELAERIRDKFKYFFWRSLQNAPPLEHILQPCIQFFSGQQRADLPKSTDEQIALLIQYLRARRCCQRRRTGSSWFLVSRRGPSPHLL
jgi:transcriptional regulator with XRE-family HTH domain